MRDRLTDRQRAVLRYIVDAIRTQGYPPTVREIGDRFGLRATNGAKTHLMALERKGYIAREHRRARSIRVLREPPVEVSRCPVDICGS